MKRRNVCFRGIPMRLVCSPVAFPKVTIIPCALSSSYRDHCDYCFGMSSYFCHSHGLLAFFSFTIFVFVFSVVALASTSPWDDGFIVGCFNRSVVVIVSLPAINVPFFILLVEGSKDSLYRYVLLEVDFFSLGCFDLELCLCTLIEVFSLICTPWTGWCSIIIRYCFFAKRVTLSVVEMPSWHTATYSGFILK